MPSMPHPVLFRRARLLFAGSVFWLSLFSAQAISAQALNQALHEQVMMIPVATDHGMVQLETTIFQPPGSGPFPLLVMNHGKALGDPRRQQRDRFLVISREFVRRGYAVAIPMRKGFSRSGGDYLETGCDMTQNGRRQADDLQAVLAHLASQSWVDKRHIVVAGQSYGGLTAIAFGARGFPGVRGLINFAGGLRVHGGTCPWQASLVQAFAEYGRHSKVPSLWFYGANDSHFEPALATSMFNAYIAGGGIGRLVAFGAFKKDAHLMSGSHDGVKIWWPETEKFLQELGLPTQASVVLADEARPVPSDFAALQNVEAVPYLQDQGRRAYRAFLGKGMPRAFAIAPSGAWSWAEDGDDPVAQVLVNCARSAAMPCTLYAVDDAVVWPAPARIAAAAPAPTPLAAATQAVSSMGK
jgi:dienelactone hydrolase